MRKFLILLTITFSSITIFAADDYVKVLTDFGVNSKSIEVLTNYTKSLNTDDAKTDLLKAIELDSENYHTYDYLGAIAKSEGHFKAAIDYFKKSIDILKENLPISGEILIVTMNNLSQLEIDMGNLPAAMNIFSEVQKIRKKYNFWNDQQLSVQYFILSKNQYLYSKFSFFS